MLSTLLRIFGGDFIYFVIEAIRIFRHPPVCYVFYADLFVINFNFFWRYREVLSDPVGISPVTIIITFARTLRQPFPLHLRLEARYIAVQFHLLPLWVAEFDSLPHHSHHPAVPFLT